MNHKGDKICQQVDALMLHFDESKGKTLNWKELNKMLASNGKWKKAVQVILADKKYRSPARRLQAILDVVANHGYRLVKPDDARSKTDRPERVNAQKTQGNADAKKNGPQHKIAEWVQGNLYAASLTRFKYQGQTLTQLGYEKKLELGMTGIMLMDKETAKKQLFADPMILHAFSVQTTPTCCSH